MASAQRAGPFRRLVGAGLPEALLLAWLLKVTSSKPQQQGAQFDIAQSFEEIIRNASLGPASGWVVILAVTAFFGWLVYATLRTDPDAGELVHGKVHV